MFEVEYRFATASEEPTTFLPNIFIKEPYYTIIYNIFWFVLLVTSKHLLDTYYLHNVFQTSRYLSGLLILP